MLLGILKGFLNAVMLVIVIWVILNLLNLFKIINLSGAYQRLPGKVANVVLPSEQWVERDQGQAASQSQPTVEQPSEQSAPVQPEQPVEQGATVQQPEQPAEQNAPVQQPEQPAEQNAPVQQPEQPADQSQQGTVG